MFPFLWTHMRGISKIKLIGISNPLAWIGMVCEPRSEQSRWFDRFSFPRSNKRAGKFSRDMSLCFSLLRLINHYLDWTAITVNLFWYFIGFPLKQNFISNFSLFPDCAFVNVIVKFGLKTVHHSDKDFSDCSRISEFQNSLSCIEISSQMLLNDQ